ncbi:MOSC domain-containing protein [Volucribacter amazonae]|uniref:Molybdenum cofactor sulfurase n=1 Tax=Volucribacter amazonae TaxID=256731 RepID=A0A9X4SJJ7_9PAST|nr:MOSC domain-containing protein [Volucribacter amazonae]MDG6894194.1 molybdenum cofactor sulfurase [Volucribacter amazonae]
MMAQILVIKIGKVQTLTFADGSVYETAIRKQPVSQVVINELGAEGNEVALTKHHGGVDKALLFMADRSFTQLNQLLAENFSYDNTAIYGENFVVSDLNEDNVCVGDRFQIGDVVLEVSQPRKPCERLSKNTNNEETQRTVFNSGLTGWYVRVIQTGLIRQGDEVILLDRPYPALTIRHLNRLLSSQSDRQSLEQALACDVLAVAFKRSLQSQLAKIK